MFSKGNQPLIALGIILGFIVALAAIAGWIVTSLSDTNVANLGHWFGVRSPAIWGFIVGAAPSIATYVWGRRAGRKSGKTEAYSSAVTTSKAANQNQLAADLRQEATDHGLKISA